MNNHEIRDVLDSVTPYGPQPIGWATRARRRSIRRRVATGAAAVTAAIVVIVPVAFSMGGDAMLIAEPDTSETSSPQVAVPSPDPAQDVPGAAACWEAPGEPRQATEEGATDGAVRAWLCGDAGDPEMFPGAVGPLEPLVEDVGEIVEFIQQQPILSDEDAQCLAVDGLNYRIVLDYGDGESRVVSGEAEGCGITIKDGERDLSGSQELYDFARDLWSQQRERVSSPGLAAVSQCRPPSRSVVADLPPAVRPMLSLAPEDAVTGFTCVEDPGAEYEASQGSILGANLVSLIGASVAKDSEEGLGEAHLPTWVTITGPWGEALTLQRTTVDTFQWFDGDTPMLWKPSPVVLAQIDGLASEPEVSLSPQGEIDPGASVAEGCGDLSAGALVSSQLPDGKLPDDATKIWLCETPKSAGVPGAAAPEEPLESPELTADATFAYNVSRVTDFDPTCLEEGAEYSVVHEYANGNKYAVSVQLSGCDVISAGGTVKEGGRAYVDTLLSLWEEQRTQE